jgi:hypothetical protein
VNKEWWASWLDRLGFALTLAVALLLRSDLGYRTAFVDEATNLHGGWRMLQGQGTYAINYHMGWPVLSFVPLGLADSLGGLTAARGLNALLGSITVLLVVMIARRVYGRAAGYVAGAIYAIYGPAIFISTFATYDALSVLLVTTGLYLWLAALLGRNARLYAPGSVAMALAVLAKYAALAVVGLGAAWVAIAAAGRRLAQPAGEDGRGQVAAYGALSELAFIGLPLLILPAYGLLMRGPLLEVWRSQVLTKQVSEAGTVPNILRQTLHYLGPLLPLGACALLEPRRRAASSGLAAIGAGMLLYHLLNRDTSTLFKHTCYIAVGLAPLAAGGLVAALKRLAAGRHESLAISAAGLLTVAVMAVSGQRMLPGLRSYWPDTTELMGYLQSAVSEGDTILMEEGAVGEYYLIAKGAPGHIPQAVADTWWYSDEHGGGKEAYKRSVVGRRFDWIVFHYGATRELGQELLRLMAGRYRLVASFPARIFGDQGTIDLFKATR